MGIQEWSDQIVVVDLGDDPFFTDDVNALFDVLAGRERHVVLDLSSVTYLNSSNVAALLKLRKNVLSRGRRLKLCGVGDAVWSVLTVTGLEGLFELASLVSTALAELQLAERAGGKTTPNKRENHG